MTQLECVQAIRKVIERGWTQGSIARDSKGNGVPAIDPRAASWCLCGACIKAWDETGRLQSVWALDFGQILEMPDYIQWNDVRGRTKEEVLVALDKLIEKLKCSEARQPDDSRGS